MNGNGHVNVRGHGEESPTLQCRDSYRLTARTA